MTSVLVLLHRDRGATDEVARHQPGPETEATAMWVMSGVTADMSRT